MAKQTFTTGQVLTAAQMTSLQQTAMGGGAATAKTASYVLVAADAGTTVAMNAAGATTITVNTGLFAAGDTVFIQNLGAGACTVTAGTATVATAGSLILPQNDAGILYFTSASAAIFYDYIQVGAASPLTTKGDLYTYSTSDTRLGVGTNGHTLVADSSEATGLKWAAPASGLTKITTQSFSATTTINVNDVFSTTYDNYIAIINFSCGSNADASFNFRFRVSGSDDSNSNYNYQRITADPSVGGAQNLNQTTAELGNATNNATQFTTIQFFNPFATAATFYYSNMNGGSASDPEIWIRSGSFNNTTSFTGFSILAQKNLTGSITVLGYAK